MNRISYIISKISKIYIMASTVFVFMSEPSIAENIVLSCVFPASDIGPSSDELVEVNERQAVVSGVTSIIPPKITEREIYFITERLDREINELHQNLWTINRENGNIRHHYVLHRGLGAMITKERHGVCAKTEIKKIF